MAAVRPRGGPPDGAQAAHVNGRLRARCDDPVRLESLRTAARQLLAVPRQQAFLVEAGLHSVRGFVLGLATRIDCPILEAQEARCWVSTERR